MTNKNTDSKKAIQNNLDKLATVTVTFNPSLLELEEQLAAIPKHAIKVVIDNGSESKNIEKIQDCIRNFERVFFIKIEKNIGLAAGINRGVEYLSKLDQPPKFILLLDQDSVPAAGSIDSLLKAFKDLQDQGRNVGCVGPLLVDPDTGLTHGFHQMTRFKWVRAYPNIGSLIPVRCANLNGSGTLVTLELFKQLGGLDNILFIDHVDTEWAFRVIAHGYSLWGIPNAIFKHSMGEESMRFWMLGWRVWPVRTPVRHYYLFRNAIILMKRPYIPLVWKIWAVVKLALTVTVMLMTGPSRKQQIKNMWLGIREGFNRDAS